MFNAKIECTIPKDGFTTKGKTYEVIDGVFKFDNGFNSEGHSSIGEINLYCESQFELIPARPHICEVLGDGKPLEVGEHFKIKKFISCDFWVEHDGLVRFTTDSHSPVHTAADSLSYAINHLDEIIRTPPFSEDEKALMRFLSINGLTWIARDTDNQIGAYSNKPEKSVILSETNFITKGKVEPLPKFMYISITAENSPFNATEYLEGLK